MPGKGVAPKDDTEHLEAREGAKKWREEKILPPNHGKPIEEPK